LFVFCFAKARAARKIELVPNTAVSELNKLLVRKAAALPPEFGTIRTVTAIFGLSRTAIFRLIAQKKIISIHYKTRPTARKGVRLIDLSSVRTFLKSFVE
jgi:hypothetical protein